MEKLFEILDDLIQRNYHRLEITCSENDRGNKLIRARLIYIDKSLIGEGPTTLYAIQHLICQLVEEKLGGYDVRGEME